MAINYEAMKKRLENSNKKGAGTKTTYLKPVDGDLVRIVDNWDGEPVREAHLHYNIGKAWGFLCPDKNFNETCPVCDFAWKLYNDAKEEKNEELQAKALAMLPAKRGYAVGVIRGKEAEGFRPWSFSETVLNKLLKYCSDPDEYGDITDIKDGTDIEVTVKDSKNKKNKVFSKMDVEAKRRRSALCPDMPDEECREQIKKVPAFNTLFGERKTQAQIQAILEEHILGSGDANNLHDDVEKYGGDKKEENKTEETKDSVDDAFDELLK